MMPPDPDSPGARRFIELATRPLEGAPELRDAARGELMGRLAHGLAPGDGERLAAATARLERKKPRRAWLPWVALCLALPLLGVTGYGIAKTFSEAWMPGWNPVFEASPAEWDLTAEEREFVFAPIGPEGEVLEKLESQRRVHPDDPGIFEEYTHRHIAVRGSLPPDFAETAGRIDPGNGLWPFLEAMEKSADWVAASTASGTPEHREILDLLERSTSAARFESHLPDLRKRRMRLLGTAEDVDGEVRRILVAISGHFFPTSRQFSDTLRHPIAVEAKRLVAEGDTEGLEDLTLLWERLVARLAGQAGTLLEQVVLISGMATAGEALEEAARDLGMSDLEQRVQARLELRTEIQKAFGMTIDPKPLSSLGQMMATTGPPDAAPEPAAFEPGRRVEFAVTERALALLATALVLLLTAGCAIESLRRGRRVNRLADGLAPLFTRVDLGWTFGLGLLLPAAWYFGITRLTPLGVRDIGLTFYKPPPAWIQAAAGLLFTVAMLVQVIRWRVGRRAGFLSLDGRKTWPGWLAAGVAAWVVPLAGSVRWASGDPETFLRAVAAAGGMPLLWLLWQAGAVLFSPKDHSLGGVMLVRRMILPLACLTTALLVSVPVLKHAERSWLARDELTRSDPEHGGVTRWETMTVEWISARYAESFRGVE